MSIRLKKIHPSPAFTLIEMLVVISLITLLISMLTPTLRNARETARAAVCLSQLHDMGNAVIAYTDAFRQEYPYGVPVPMATVDHPHYTGWNQGARGGGIPPQQQFYSLGFIRDNRAYRCASDPSPQNYNWWDYDVHPDITTGSSYMFSEYALFGVAWQNRKILRTTHVYQPSNFAYVTDGWMCPNGWTWGIVDPDDAILAGQVRIDWTHLGGVNVLFGDNHGERRSQLNARKNLRVHPLQDF